MRRWQTTHTCHLVQSQCLVRCYGVAWCFVPSLLGFHQHTTGLYVRHYIDTRPDAVDHGVRWANVKPPSVTTRVGTATERIVVVVAVRRAELHSVGVVCWVQCRRHRITGVSAVPGHRQPVLTNLITDGERRVFSRVPQTRRTLDLRTINQSINQSINQNIYMAV